ncbi:hypothetical protein U0129_19085 [Enterobacter hormaechei]|uniref:hypothetical protein n=1 Tax=Enterobacter hormaechei TaxID=158836 RepID=UPI0039C3D1F5
MRAIDWKSYFWMGAIVLVGGSIGYKLIRTEPSLMALTGVKLSEPTVFKPCDPKNGSLTIAFKSNEEVVINGITSKILSFGAYEGRDKPPITSCKGKTVSNISFIETGSYSFHISRQSNEFFISDVKNKITDEILPGTWTFH